MYIYEGGRVSPVKDLIEGSLAMEINRQVRLTRLAGLTISTVFLGVDHNIGMGNLPVLWETMVFTDLADFKPGADLGQWRYTSRRDAVNGHETIVASMRTFLAQRNQA